MEYKDATAHMTLGEMGERDVDNFGLLFKDCKHYFFDTLREATVFFGECIRIGFLRVGVGDIHQLKIRIAEGGFKPLADEEINQFGDHFNKVLIEKGIRWEMRPKSHYPDKEDIERRGFYIFKQNEIAYFIGNPKVMRRSKGPNQSLLILPERFKNDVKLRVSTNVPINRPMIAVPNTKILPAKMPNNGKVIMAERG